MRKLCKLWALRYILFSSFLWATLWVWQYLRNGQLCSISCRPSNQESVEQELGAVIGKLEAENSKLRDELVRLYKEREYGTVGETLLPRAQEDLRAGITLAIHGDIGRLGVMLHSREQWIGQEQEASVVLAILVRNSRDMQTAERVLRPIESRRLRWCVYSPPQQGKNESSPGDALWPYPANIMRNRALQLVETEQVLLLDADFIPSTSMRSIARTGAPGLRRGQLLIVPPFQLTTNSTVRNKDVAWERLHQSGLLLNKASFIDCFDSAAAAYHSAASPSPDKPFASVCGGERGLFLAPFARYLAANVNYKKWWTATEPYPAANITETEPYFIAHTREMLAFDERFVGYGACVSTMLR